MDHLGRLYRHAVGVPVDDHLAVVALVGVLVGELDRDRTAVPDRGGGDSTVGGTDESQAPGGLVERGQR